MNTSTTVTCRTCRQGAMMPIERATKFHPPCGEVIVQTLAAKCNHCGAESVLSSQRAENIARLNARKASYGEYLMGEEIFRFRRKFGLTQQDAAKIFGKGLIAFSRYENEKSFPDLSTTKLLRIAFSRLDVLKQLADEADVEIPLWEERCREERAKKLINLKPVEAPRRVETTFVEMDTPFDTEYRELIAL